jgi:hypothetical protein
VTLSEECPCGRARAGCEYHDPTLQPPAAGPRVTTYDAKLAKVTLGGEDFDLDMSSFAVAPSSPEVILAGITFKTLQVTKQAQNTRLFTLVVDPSNHTEYQSLKYMYAAQHRRDWPFSVKWDDVSFEHHPRACWDTLPTRDPVTGLATYVVRVLP